MSVSNYLETVLLDLVFNATAYAGQATVYAKLHVGDPGEAGTSNAAAETTRQAVTFGAASAGSIANDVAVNWTNYPNGTDAITHCSLWDASTAGNHLWNGPAVGGPFTPGAGNTLQIPIGSITVALD